jgi:hypothetical protein
MGEGDLAIRGSTAAALDAYLVFEDEAGSSMTPPTARTWSHRGNTPIVGVRGRSQRRISLATLACSEADDRSRLIYQPMSMRTTRPAAVEASPGRTIATC